LKENEPHTEDQGYQTPKGKDERLYPMPDRFKYLEKVGVKCLKYGHTLVLQGGGYSTSIFDEIRKKQNNNESVVVAATGYPGKGKTYGVIRICQKLDPKFHLHDIPPPDPSIDDGQIAFSRAHLDYLTGEKTPLKRGQVIVIDEAHYGVGARKWGEREQQEIVDHIAAIRSKGFLLFLVVLHTEMIDKILRKFVFNYEFSFHKRGTAIAYRKYFPQFAKEPYVKRLGRVKLLLPDEQFCNALDCFKCKEPILDLKNQNPEGRCETLRAIYERRKEWFLNHTKDEEEKEQNNNHTDDELALLCIPALGVSIKLNRVKYWDKPQIKKHIQENIKDYKPSDRQVDRIQSILMRSKPPE